MLSAAFGSKVMISLNSTFGELKMIIKARFAVKQWQIKIACSGEEKLITKYDFRFKHAQKHQKYFSSKNVPKSLLRDLSTELSELNFSENLTQKMNAFVTKTISNFPAKTLKSFV